MKINLFFILVSLFAHGQVYNFDYYLRFADNTTASNGERIIQLLVDSSDKNMIMTLERDEKETKAILQDWDNLITHHFILKDVKFPLSSKSFQYKFSEKKSPRINENHRTFKISDLHLENQETIVTVTETTTKSKNKRVATLRLIPFDQDLASFQMIYLFDHQTIGEKIKFDKKYILKEGEIKFRHPNYGEVIHRQKILNLDKQDLQIILRPDQIKYK